MTGTIAVHAHVRAVRQKRLPLEPSLGQELAAMFCFFFLLSAAAHAQFVPLTNVVQVSAGREHTCALTAGAVKCWGRNDFQQIGDGTQTIRQSPVEVVGLGSGVQAISAGSYHTCALTQAGNVKCWGTDALLNPTLLLVPYDIAGLPNNIQAISAGGAHTCALTATGGVLCWGNNQFGQLGDGTTTDRSAPVPVLNLSSGVQAISAGGDFTSEGHTCALTGSGGVKCWGDNRNGQLGDGTSINRSSPVDVTAFTSGISAIGVGSSNTCAATQAGGVRCWGGAGPAFIFPGSPIADGGGVVGVDPGGQFGCALTSVGGVQCWGRNEVGQLGNGGTTLSVTGVPVTGLGNGVQQISTGPSHACALKTTGEVQCWGANTFSQLGDGTSTRRSVPTEVVGLGSGLQAISVSLDHSCALTSAGGVKCWGGNSSGQLGDGTFIDRLTPGDVAGLTSGVQAISAAEFAHTCALTNAGEVKCWGFNYRGQLGDGTLLLSSQ